MTQSAEGKELTDEQQSRRQENINQALARLRESITVGSSDFDLMRHDPDLAILHGLLEFEELLPESAVPTVPE